MRSTPTLLAAVLIFAGAAPLAAAKPREGAPHRAVTGGHASAPRLTAAQLSSLPATAGPGARVVVRGAVTNPGARAARGRVVVRLLRRGTAAHVLGTARVAAAAHGRSAFATTVTLPRVLGRGSYQLVACVPLAGRAGALGCVNALRPVVVGPAPAVRGPRATPRAAAADATCSSGGHTLSVAGDHVYPETGNTGYTSVHTDVNLVYDAAKNLFLPGNHVTLTDAATQCLSDFSLDLERTNGTADGPALTVGKVLVDGRPASFTFVQPTYPGDPNGQDDPDPAAHESGQDTPASATNPLPPACAPDSDDPAENGKPCRANKLVITPSAPIAGGDTFTVEVDYTGRPGVHLDGDGTTEGWFRSDVPAGDGSFVTTEPVGSEDWMPLNDHPSAKPTYDFTDQVTLGRTAISNGELVEFNTLAPDANFPAGSSLWRWHSPEPIASYLVESSVGAFDLTERLADSGTLFYEAQGSGLSAQTKAENKAIQDEQEDITNFEARFSGPFPFTSDGVVIGVPDASFEEEMQTKITFNGGTIDEDTLYHENQHQWWGDNVSESNYKNTFIKEGLATLAEYEFAARTDAEKAGGLDTPAGQTAFAASLSKTFTDNYTSIPYDVASSNPTAADLFGSQTYDRAGTAYVALREIMGADAFDGTLKAIQREYGGGSITEPELEAAFTGRLPNQSATCTARLGTFFAQWFDTVYPKGSYPPLTPATFYDTSGSCQQTVPVTSSSVTGTTLGATYVDPTVTLTAADDGGPGVAGTTYALDGGSSLPYTGPFTVGGDGAHTVTFASTDAAGDVEATKTLSLQVASPPVTTATVAPGLAADGTVAGPVSVALTASDATGVASTQYALDGGAFTPYVGPVVVTGDGPHTLQYDSTDRLGAVEAAQTLSFTIVEPPVVTPAPACASPVLSFALAQKPLRGTLSKPILKKGTTYRYRGQLICAGRPAPSGTAISVSSIIKDKSSRSAGTTTSSTGKFTVLLRVRSGRTLLARYGTTSSPRVRVHVTH